MARQLSQVLAGDEIDSVFLHQVLIQPALHSTMGRTSIAGTLSSATKSRDSRLP